MKLIKNKKLIFRFDIGNKDGLGHYNRSLILIKYFLKKKYTIKICTNTKSKIFFSKQLQKLIFLKNRNETEDKYINRISLKFSKYIVFIDKLYDYKKREILNLKINNQVIFIQNFSKTSLIADKTIFPEIHNNVKIKKNQVYAGLKYFLIRDDILKIKKIDKKKILAVTFGGSDPFNLTLKILKILKIINWQEKTVFYIGRAFTKNLKNKLKTQTKKYSNFHISNFDIKKIINSKLVISSFGNFAYEMAYLNKLTLVVLLKKNIKIPINNFFKNTINLGYYPNINSKMIKNNLNKHFKMKSNRQSINIKDYSINEYLKILNN